MGVKDGIGDKVMGLEAKFFMGRVMPRAFLDGVGDYLEQAVPERKDELIGAIEARTDELVEADHDRVVDRSSEGALALGAVVQASYETLLPLFEGDERRTILFLQHTMGPVLRRPYALMFSTLSRKDQPLDKIDKACRGAGGLYGDAWDIRYERPEPGRFEMNVHHCFWRDFFARQGNALTTTVLCAWDSNWMQAIDPAVSGLRAERTSLLSLGDDQCRFAVEETDDPLAGYSDKLDTRFVEPAETKDATDPAVQ